MAYAHVIGLLGEKAIQTYSPFKIVDLAKGEGK